MAALVASLLVALFLGLGFAFAAPWLVLVPIAVIVLAIIWGAVLLASDRTLPGAVRRTRRVELLGPGGPDDPDRSR
jgi:hypothetical protein